MTQRFQIEDILEQDHHGVVFSAVDGETGRRVALRRFFPFGSDGGGLQAEEQVAYGIGVKRLSEVIHPALRAVVTGGCDPVDGMPFLATEWVEGSKLSDLLQKGALTPGSAITLMTQALETSELLSQVLADDEVWVETAPSAIIIGDGGSERGITFWISPFRWLNTEESRPGLLPLAELLEASMGWTGKKVGDQAGDGLGAWLNWLKTEGKTATISQGRAALEAAIQGRLIKPTPTKAGPAKVPAAAAGPLVLRKPKTSWTGPVVIGLLVITALSLGGLLYYQKRLKTDASEIDDPGETKASKHKRRSPKSALPEDLAPPEAPKKAPVAEPEKPSPPASESALLAAANARASELSSEKAKELELRNKRLKEIESKNGVFAPTDLELVALQSSKAVKVEGVLLGVGQSNSGKTGYLRFSTDVDPNLVEGKFDKPTKDPGLQDAALTALIGKRIRISGTVEVTKLQNFRRVQVDFPNRAAIEVLP